MTPRYCIAIARKGGKTSALAIADKLSELDAAITESPADEVDIFAKGHYVKTVRPDGIRAQAKAIAEREQRLAQAAPKPAPAPKAKADKPAKAKAKPAPAASEEENDDPLAG